MQQQSDASIRTVQGAEFAKAVHPRVLKSVVQSRSSDARLLVCSHRVVHVFRLLVQGSPPGCPGKRLLHPGKSPNCCRQLLAPLAQSCPAMRQQSYLVPVLRSLGITQAGVASPCKLQPAKAWAITDMVTRC